ncbi:Vesicle transport v-SNARE protein vti1 [Tolypocladium paradoxum]|uniref:Vesicle transport v-SNARE protein vti1 n=1 Tax=Tolypocladium paradoxum TaxID=94208 RepID=A0A2S4KUN8_9HYPO|nr:Vesicle transport v-SNARE protein vti1 [Tolypocladium paradoxum]
MSQALADEVNQAEDRAPLHTSRRLCRFLLPLRQYILAASPCKMANPLDTDAGSELFGSYEAELKLVQADLSQKLDQIPELSGEPRKTAISQAERALEEADELLGQMRLEKQNIPTSSRAKVNQRFRNYEADVDANRRKLTSLSSDRSALFGSRYTDEPAGASDIHLEQRQQLLSGTDRLDRSTQRLKSSQALANETEAIGADTLANLHGQREMIQHTHDTLLNSEGYVDRSVKTLRGMARRMATNRVITISIITVLVILIVAVIVSKFRSRISLISKSDIRYVGTLHEINSDESTVSLENVRSFGTEGRRGRPEEEIAPSDQVYEYIVFRGSDVKDLRIEEHPGIKENKPPPAMPDDPAIVGARARDGVPPNRNMPPGAGAFQPLYPPNNFYGGPPPPGSWGRGGGPGPMPGPGFGNMPYPPPGWFPPGQGPPGQGPPVQGPPVQGFPPGGPGPWNNQPFPPGPGGPPGPDAQNQRQAPPSGPVQDSKAGAIGPGADRPKAAIPSAQPVPAMEPKSLAQAAGRPAHAPSLPVESKPSVEEVKAAATTVSTNGSGPGAADPPKPAPVAPRNNRVTPVVPLSGSAAKPFQLPNASRAGQASAKPAATAGPNSVEDATSAARAAVAVAMAQLGTSGGTAMDNLTNKVNEMRVNAGRGTSAPRGRGRGGRHGTQKVEVPDSDFDFAQANAKFNREEIAKEAIAGSPLAEHPTEPAAQTPEDEVVSNGNPAVAYNKSKSFFDNISSEAKDRADSGGHKPGGREWRGEEQRKNMETFGQGSVDGGYRNYRGRGRGRGGRGRGYERGSRGGNRPQYQQGAADQ